MLNAKVKDLINTQLNLELYSAYLYLDFANYYYDKGLDGFARYYDIQAQEERDHAMHLRSYLHDNGESVTFEAIAKPDKAISAIDDPIKFALEHEIFITGSINVIYKAADEVGDYRTMQYLDWYVKEQGEEEKNADDLLKKYNLFGTDPKGLYELNQELLGRTYTPATFNL